MPKHLFLLKPVRSNALKATRAVLAAGVARRMLQRQAGGYGEHDSVEFFRIPSHWGCKKKKRNTRVVHFCNACRNYADTPNRLKAMRCAPSPGSAGRAQFMKRLPLMLTEDHPADLIEGARALLAKLTEAPPQVVQHGTSLQPACAAQASAAHDVVALAWPVLGPKSSSFAVRFVCRTCCVSSAVRSKLAHRACGALNRGARAMRHHLEEASGSSDCVVARTAQCALQQLGPALPSTSITAPAVRVATLAEVAPAGLRPTPVSPARAASSCDYARPSELPTPPSSAPPSLRLPREP